MASINPRHAACGLTQQTTWNLGPGATASCCRHVRRSEAPHGSRSTSLKETLGFVKAGGKMRCHMAQDLKSRGEVARTGHAHINCSEAPAVFRSMISPQVAAIQFISRGSAWVQQMPPHDGMDEQHQYNHIRAWLRLLALCMMGQSLPGPVDPPQAPSCQEETAERPSHLKQGSYPHWGSSSRFCC
ncbi:hypothetical protein B0T21DRAFT_353171 [Apiosordaria backusii]|uniref:Uncharacterized protein n=1 Tax=Apiosordaria backusii TaxID=314023 RepID=A0AA39ZVD6_9PEZI|nr:hypothetical protein B0T21DRAFT_353171 [Apiosordaria backusii]